MMALALETALPDPKSSRITWIVDVKARRPMGEHEIWEVFPWSRTKRLEVGDLTGTTDSTGSWTVVCVMHPVPLRPLPYLTVKPCSP